VDGVQVGGQLPVDGQHRVDQPGDRGTDTCGSTSAWPVIAAPYGANRPGNYLRVSDARDNALAETIIGLYNTECAGSPPENTEKIKGLPRHSAVVPPARHQVVHVVIGQDRHLSGLQVDPGELTLVLLAVGGVHQGPAVR
jgi:hypothetical protein